MVYSIHGQPVHSTDAREELGSLYSNEHTCSLHSPRLDIMYCTCSDDLREKKGISTGKLYSTYKLHLQPVVQLARLMIAWYPRVWVQD